MSTTAHSITAQELFSMSRDGIRRELVRGELKEMSPAGFEHGTIVADLTILLGNYLKSRQLGRLCGAETGFLLSKRPDTVRAPDLAFIANHRIAAAGILKTYWPGAPDLAIEVVSPNDRIGEVEQKVQTWLQAGSSAVWLVDPQTRTVRVYEPTAEPLVLRGDELLSGGGVIPGFACRVKDLFRDA